MAIRHECNLQRQGKYFCFGEGRKATYFCFLEQLQEEEVSFAIVGKPRTIVTNTRVDELPIEVQKLLEEYVDIVVDDLRGELPHVRIISHNMYLIPRASFPNKVAYRMTPAINAEINRQVQELLNKGLV